MTDYSKLKVPELKDELKARGVSLAGLKLKQQLIDRLVQLDGVVDAPAYESEKAEENAEEAHRDVDTGAAEVLSEQPPIPSIYGSNLPVGDGPPQSDERPEAETVERRTELKTYDDTAKSILQPTTGTGEEVGVGIKPADKTHPEKVSVSEEVQGGALEAAIEEVVNEEPRLSTPPLKPEASDMPAPDSSAVPISELIEDSRKRKRRSMTPPPTAEDVAQKKAKVEDGSPVVTKRAEPSALEQMQAATDAAEAIREPDGLADEQVVGMDVKHRDVDDQMEPDESRHTPSDNIQASQQAGSSSRTDLARTATLDSPEPEPERAGRSVSPALHSATSSLYIRNFKRPLHIPTLRSHLTDLAKSPSTTSSEDPVQTFYMDSIRTHALVSFTSIAAASRVRSSMHETRFPDERSREPLWMDFVPDDRVQEWIDQESGSGRNGGKKWEVVYTDHGNGIEASLQEVGSDGSARRQDSLPQRQRSLQSYDEPRTASLSGVHPDRASLVPDADEDYGRRNSGRDAVEARSAPPSDTGVGFKALDELFSFTTAKPKLYYKPVAPSVVEDRLDLIKDLRVGHADMGKSGDPDMKRYTLEDYKGRPEWVDKGPEFGYGRKGAERLAGQRGGYRGGGEYRGSGEYRGGGYRGRRFDYDRPAGESYRGR